MTIIVDSVIVKFAFAIFEYSPDPIDSCLLIFLHIVHTNDERRSGASLRKSQMRGRDSQDERERRAALKISEATDVTLAEIQIIFFEPEPTLG